MGDVDWTSLLDSLLWVERLGSADSGLLSFDPAPGGGIFVEAGRICWVGASGLSRRLRDLLSPHQRATDRELDRVYERCRLEGRVFGQTLVAEGLIEPLELEFALRRHSAESLIRLSETRRPRHWSSRGGRGYAAQFTFQPCDLLREVADVLMPEQVGQAQAELAPLAGAARRAAAFLLEPTADVAVPVLANGTGLTVELLRTLGQWLLSVSMATRELAATPAFVLASNPDGQSVSCWSKGSLFFAVLCDDRETVAAVTAHHLATA